MFDNEVTEIMNYYLDIETTGLDPLHAKITNTTGGLPPVDFVLTLIDDVRRNRFRSLSTEDMSDLLEEINEEMLAGKIMFQHMIDEKTWSMTGEHPNKNTNWRDMR